MSHLIHTPASKRKDLLVGDYVVGVTIGTGTYGKVKHARHTKTGSVYAVKIIDAARHPSPSDIAKEVTMLSRLSHKNVIGMVETLTADNKYYLVLEFAAGGELFDRIEPGFGIDENFAHVFFCQLVAGIGYIHSTGLCHRDIKPENLLLSLDGQLKITDFGLATPFRKRGKRRRLTRQCGSVIYMAPEILSAGAYYGDEVDVWSMGAVLFVMLAGEKPWAEATAACEQFVAVAEGHFDFSPWSELPRDALNLLKGILVVDGASRLTIPDICQHIWFTRFNYINRRKRKRRDSDELTADELASGVEGLSVNPSAASVASAPATNPATTGASVSPAPMNDACNNDAGHQQGEEVVMGPPTQPVRSSQRYAAAVAAAAANAANAAPDAAGYHDENGQEDGDGHDSNPYQGNNAAMVDMDAVATRLEPIAALEGRRGTGAATNSDRACAMEGMTAGADQPRKLARRSDAGRRELQSASADRGDDQGVVSWAFRQADGSTATGAIASTQQDFELFVSASQPLAALPGAFSLSGGATGGGAGGDDSENSINTINQVLGRHPAFTAPEAGETEAASAALAKASLVCPEGMAVYQDVIRRMTRFTTFQPPRVVLRNLAASLDEVGCQAQVNRERYSIRASSELGSSHQVVRFDVFILYMQQGRYVVDFRRSHGSVLEFKKIFVLIHGDFLEKGLAVPSQIGYGHNSAVVGAVGKGPALVRKSSDVGGSATATGGLTTVNYLPASIG